MQDIISETFIESVKQTIDQLMELTEEKINCLSTEESMEFRNKYIALDALKKQIWKAFQSLDFDKSEKRTLELINNYATSNREMHDEFINLMSFFTPKPKGFPHIAILEKTAKLYLDCMSKFETNRDKLAHNLCLLNQHMQSSEQQESQCVIT